MVTSSRLPSGDPSIPSVVVGTQIKEQMTIWALPAFCLGAHDNSTPSLSVGVVVAVIVVLLEVGEGRGERCCYRNTAGF